MLARKTSTPRTTPNSLATPDPRTGDSIQPAATIANSATTGHVSGESGQSRSPAHHSPSQNMVSPARAVTVSQGRTWGKARAGAAASTTTHSRPGAKIRGHVMRELRRPSR